jgi:hypothetical protein
MQESMRGARFLVVASVILPAGCNGRVGSAMDDETSASTSGASSDSGSHPDLPSDADRAELDMIPGELEQIIDGAHAWYQSSDVPRRCPHHDGAAEHSWAGHTPPLALDCYVGPDHRCVPGDGVGLGHYDQWLWTDDAVWAAIGFEKTTPHLAHYYFEATNDLEGSCSFIVEARADLDGDTTEYSIYRIQGTIDGDGVHAEPIEIIDPYE